MSPNPKPPQNVVFLKQLIHYYMNPKMCNALTLSVFDSLLIDESKLGPYTWLCSELVLFEYALFFLFFSPRRIAFA